MDPTHDNWKKVEENLNSFFGTVSEQCQSILSLSYSYLPQYLRACFLYIGGFPEAMEIGVSKLIRLWIAEQFVKAISNKRLEVVGEEYLEELIDRSLILAYRLTARGRRRSCKIHDLLRQLCLREAHSENVVHTMNWKVPMSLEALFDQRRVILLSKLQGTQVFPTMNRSAITCTFISMESFSTCFPKGIYSIVSQLKLLKVLDVLSIEYDFSWVIPQLVHLRYVAATIMEDVSLVNLRNLQTIILEGYYGSTELRQPLDIWTLSEIRYVDIRGTLYISNPLVAENNSIGKQALFLNNLQTLCLDSANLLEKLETLYLAGQVIFSGNILPSNLKKLSLADTWIAWEDMNLLANLPNLEVFTGYSAFHGTDWKLNEDVVFRKLKYLLLWECLNLQRWEAGSDNFPMLEKLLLRMLVELEEIPPSVGEIMTLKLIQIDHCSSGVEISANKIQEEQQSWGNYELHVEIIDNQSTLKQIFEEFENESLNSEEICQIADDIRSI